MDAAAALVDATGVATPKQLETPRGFSYQL
jgi:hypothetical protein